MVGRASSERSAALVSMVAVRYTSGYRDTVDRRQSPNTATHHAIRGLLRVNERGTE